MSEGQPFLLKEIVFESESGTFNIIRSRNSNGRASITIRFEFKDEHDKLQPHNITLSNDGDFDYEAVCLDLADKLTKAVADTCMLPKDEESPKSMH